MNKALKHYSPTFQQPESMNLSLCKHFGFFLIEENLA
jgi:hypothetical protein